MLRKRSVILLILFFSMPCFAVEQYVPGQMLVKFRDDVVSIRGGERVGIFSSDKTDVSSASIKALNAKHKLQKLRSFAKKEKKFKKLRSGDVVELPDLSRIYLLEFPKDIDVKVLIDEYKRDPSVEFAEPNYIRRLFIPDDNYYRTGPSPNNSSNQWGLYKIWLTSMESQTSGWNKGTGSTEVKVAVIDTGVNYNHLDLVGRVNSLEGTRCISGDPSNDPMDDHGHGTHVSGIIGAKTDNSFGMAGVDWNCKIIPIKAFNSDGSASDADIIDALQWAVSKDAGVINMSFGDYNNSTSLGIAIAYAATSDAVLVAAAGNDNTSQKSYPAAYDKVISVAALAPGDYKASYSNSGTWVDVSAPGGSNGPGAQYYLHYILSTWPFEADGVTPSNDKFAYLAGTSMATPFVVGLSALIRAKYPLLTAEAVSQRVINFSDNIDSYNPGYEERLGKGRINAFAALGGLYGYISYPASNGIAYGNINIKGNATGEAFDHYTVEYSRSSDPTRWITIEALNTVPKLNATLAVLDLTGLDDDVTVRLRVNELATAETKVTFHAGSREDPILAARAEYGPNPFNPNKQQVMIKYDLTRNSEVYIYFYDITGNLLCRKFYPAAVNGGNQGTNRVYWDGKTDFGGTVANGVYLFKIASEGRTIGKGKIIVLK